MTDIVERLRACHGIMSGDPECCCAEAAAEIERLRALLREVHAWMDDEWEGEFKAKIGKALEGS